MQLSVRQNMTGDQLEPLLSPGHPYCVTFVRKMMITELVAFYEKVVL